MTMIHDCGKVSANGLSFGVELVKETPKAFCVRPLSALGETYANGELIKVSSRWLPKSQICLIKNAKGALECVVPAWLVQANPWIRVAIELEIGFDPLLG